MRQRETYVYVHLAEGPVPAGLLTMVEDGRNSRASFAYGLRYLDRTDRVAVDPVALPLPAPGERRSFETDEGFAVFNGIRDAAPDGWGRYLLGKAAGGQPLDEFDYLVASGEQRVGALAFGPTLEGPQRKTAWDGPQGVGDAFDLAELMQAALQVQEVEQLTPHLRRLLSAASSLGGARPKATTTRDGRSWIAKFPAKDDRYPMERLEFATMSLAAKCGLRVPPVALETVLGTDIYLIERFDRTSSKGKERRTPFASGLTMLGAHESELTRHSYGDLADGLRRLGSDPRTDLLELFRRMLFNILVSNDDDHLRNHGFLFDARGWRLSPLYDVVPKPQVGHERYLTLAVGPQGRRATVENAVAGAAAFGLSVEQAETEARALAGAVAQGWEAGFTKAGIVRAEVDRFATCFEQAHAAIG